MMTKTTTTTTTIVMYLQIFLFLIEIYEPEGRGYGVLGKTVGEDTVICNGRLESEIDAQNEVPGREGEVEDVTLGPVAD
eukprot:2490581-Heterocapsa_arctica.AAC.1